MAAAPRTRRCAPGPARGTPSPRRNHGFAPRLQSGADAEAILSEAPVRAAEHRGGCTRLLSRAGPRARRSLGRDRYQPRRPPRLPHAGTGLVATPPPRPPRIRLRSDTRNPCPTPGHVSRFPGGPLSFGQTKGPRDAAEPAGPRTGAPDRRAKGGGGGHKAAFVPPRPACCGGRNRPHPPRRPGRTAPAAPGSAGTGKPVPPAINRQPAAPRTPASAFPQPVPPSGHRAVVRPLLASDPPELRAGAVGSGRRAPNKGDGGDGGAGRGAPAPEAAVRRILTGICLLIEDCGLIIQPVPRRRRHRRRQWRRLQGRG